MNFRNLLILLRNFKIRKYRKGEHLIQQGSTSKEVFFIRKGLVRSYYENDNAEEITFQLYPEHQIVINIHNILFQEPSKFFYQALEQTRVYSIDYDFLLEITSKNSGLLEISRTYIGRNGLKEVFQRIESFVLLSPEDRYTKYIKSYPSIVNRAPDKYIANVLGITPVSLSRIRKRLASKKD